MENSLHHLNFTGSNLGSYQQSGIRQPQNARDITNNVYYGGNANSQPKPRTYDAEYNQRNNTNKSSTIDGRMSMGNLNVMGNSMNMTSKKKDDLITNIRQVHGNRMIIQSPSVNEMGLVQGLDHHNHSKSQENRNEGLHNQLNENPYHYDITNIL